MALMINKIEESVTSFMKINQASETNLIEEDLTPIKFSNNSINITVKPCSISTLKFK